MKIKTPVIIQSPNFAIIYFVPVVLDSGEVDIRNRRYGSSTRNCSLPKKQGEITKIKSELSRIIIHRDREGD